MCCEVGQTIGFCRLSLHVYGAGRLSSVGQVARPGNRAQPGRLRENRKRGAPAMDMDKRLEKLVERHEALSQTVEILAGMQRENEKRFDQVTHNFEIVLDSIKRLETVATRRPAR